MTLSSILNMRAKVLVGVLLTLALAGCAPPAAPFDPPPPAAESTPTPTPESITPAPVVHDPSAEPLAAASVLTLPSCDALLTLAAARIAYNVDVVAEGEVDVAQLPPLVAGVVGTSALDSASQKRACAWSTPNAAQPVYLVIAQISPETRATLTSALAQGGYKTGSDRGAERFELVWNGADGAVHLFDGGLWVVSRQAELTSLREIAQSGLEAVRAATPTS